MKNQKSGDLLTAPPKLKKAATSNRVSSGAKKEIRKGDSATSKKNGSVQQQAEVPAAPIKPDKDYLDVYIGNCEFTTEAIASAKRFSAEHTNYFVRYYGMKTQSADKPDKEQMKGLEIYLPLDAHKFHITTVPAFVLNSKGKNYKISGAAELSDVYREIDKNLAKGEKKHGYIDLGERGRGCNALSQNFSPATLTQGQKRAIAAEVRLPDVPTLLSANRIGIPGNSEPVYIDKQTVPIAAGRKFIVFSESQSDWAVKEMKSGAVGCCTDCVQLGRLWPYAQYCSQDMLTILGVSSVPSVVTFKSAVKQ